jgi:peptidoglycan hydrolase-like protein with peptidoglycan-binding domain
VIKSGSRGTEAYATQKLLQYRNYDIGTANPDGIVGANTVAAIKKFQTANQLTADGAAGTNTLSKLVATVQSGSNNGAVYALQYLLKNKFGQNVPVDGVFGSGTLAGVKAFQSAVGLTADGIAGQNTWRELFGASVRTIPIPVASLTSASLADGTYTIQGKTSGKVVDINGASKENGATAHIWPSNSGDNQKFAFVRLSDGTYKITVAHSERSLEVRNSSLSDGADVAQWDYDANYACKRWYVVACGDDYYKFINKNSGKALDVSGNGTADGTNLQQWTDNGTDAQRFRLIPVVKATSNIAISGFTAPTSLTKGQAYSIAGTVSSNNKITKVTISVGSEISVSATPNATSYSLKGLDSSVKFGSLSAGTKTLTITVTDTVASKPFTYSFVVKEPTVVPVPAPSADIAAFQQYAIANWTKPVKATILAVNSGREFGVSRDSGARAHAAIDYYVTNGNGTPVYAMTSGTVIEYSLNTFYAGTGAIAVKNSDGSVLRYCEITPSVKNGASVTKG